MINNDYESFNILLIKINPYLSPITHPMNHNSKNEVLFPFAEYVLYIIIL